LGDNCALICCLPAHCACLLLLQLHKLETALNWHLQYGALQDASVLQLLVVQAAADGNAAIMGLLLPLFDKQGWLVSMHWRQTRTSHRALQQDDAHTQLLSCLRVCFSALCGC
jgi:hypothetical protein